MLTGEYNLNPDNRRFNFRPIVVQDIRDAMGKIKTSKSLGSDNISSYFLKLATPYIENSLVFMFNTSLETSQFPDSWKNAFRLVGNYTRLYRARQLSGWRCRPGCSNPY